MDDVAGVKLDSEIPARIGPAGTLNLRGQITAPRFTNADTMMVTLRQYPGSPIVSQTYQVGASGRFDVAFQIPAEARGVYELTIELSQSRRITDLAPFIVE